MDAPALIASVRNAYGQARQAAQSISDATLRGQSAKAIETLGRAIDAWAGEQLARVQRGEKPESWWTEYAQSLLEQIKRYVRDDGAFLAQWSAASLAIGSGALSIDSWVRSTLDSGRERLKTFRQQLDQFKAQQARLAEVQARLQARQNSLSDEAHSVLFGAEASVARASLATFEELVVGLQKVFDLVDSGAKPIVSGNDFNVESSAVLVGPPRPSTPSYITSFNPSPYAVSGLGNPVALGAGGVVAAIALCGSLAISLVAYFKHADKVIEGDLEQKLIALPAGERQATIDALTKMREAGKSPDPFESIVTGLKVLAITGAVGAAIWAAVKFIQARKAAA